MEQMDDTSRLSRNLMRLIETLVPEKEKIHREIEEFKNSHPNYSKRQLANKWGDRICKLYAAEGALTALPSSIPGIGTIVQVGVEAGAISVDLAYMIRCMSGMSIGISVIYEKDISSPFNQDFVRVLGLWCGVLDVVKQATNRVTKKIAVQQFKRVPAEIFKKINRKVGTTIVTKYGTKRGGIAVGRLIPFGVGAIVGGTFNLVVMKKFKKSAIAYYGEQDIVLEMNE